HPLHTPPTVLAPSLAGEANKGHRCRELRCGPIPGHGRKMPNRSFEGLAFDDWSANDHVVYQDGGDFYVRGYSKGAQKAWLERELAAAHQDHDVDWIVVRMHQAAISTADKFNGAATHTLSRHVWPRHCRLTGLPRSFLGGE